MVNVEATEGREIEKVGSNSRGIERLEALVAHNSVVEVFVVLVLSLNSGLVWGWDSSGVRNLVGSWDSHCRV